MDKALKLGWDGAAGKHEFMAGDDIVMKRRDWSLVSGARLHESAGSTAVSVAGAAGARAREALTWLGTAAGLSTTPYKPRHSSAIAVPLVAQPGKAQGSE
ncbi:hypothetical protein CKAH01_08606 [Colletotrichum kahawae]|uniref:Uncharacterized protein n=1 Tax=Colletotrichum kahawae TaxID=34407 RepID=A0AAD9Y3G5_COLKA|nr:hypothetical protein CKAH01_08606 [Colletotrichum kahawae]